MSLFIHRREKHIVSMIKSHVDLVVETVCLTVDALNLYLEGKKDQSVEYTKQVHRKEHEADVIQHEIDTEMFGGAFMPSVREALFVTVDTVDKVANRAEKLGDFMTLIVPEIPDEIIGDVKRIGELTCSCAHEMSDAIYSLFEDIGAVHEKTTSIEGYETEVDKLAWQVLESVFRKLDIDKFSHRMMLREMILHLSSISNKMEDASDRIDIIRLRLKS
jgi:predicted phosphate transport protein (TIGR00153 family)